CPGPPLTAGWAPGAHPVATPAALHVVATRYRPSWPAVEVRLAPAAVGGPGAGGVLVEPLGQVEALEHELDGRRHRRGALVVAGEHGDGLAERGDLGDEVDVARRRHVLAGVDDAAVLEGGDDLDQAPDVQLLAPHREHR